MYLGIDIDIHYLGHCTSNFQWPAIVDELASFNGYWRTIVDYATIHRLCTSTALFAVLGDQSHKTDLPSYQYSIAY
jgi:hypothetical protein